MDEPTLERGLVLRLCRGHSCGKKLAELEAELRRLISERGLEGQVAVAYQTCYGRCFSSPNILVERWRNGRRNDKAMLAMMMNLPHPDLQFESRVQVEDLPGLLRHHLQTFSEAQQESAADAPALDAEEQDPGTSLD